MKHKHQPHVDIRSQLRFASQTEADELVRFKLRTTADEIDAALADFIFAPSSVALATLQGHWACGVRVLGSAGETRHHLSLSEPLEPAT